MVTFKFTIEFKMQCSKCSTFCVQQCIVEPQMPIPYPMLPFGWNTVNGIIICDRHVILIDPDRKVMMVD